MLRRTLFQVMIAVTMAWLVASCGGRIGPVRWEPTPSPLEWEEARKYAERRLATWKYDMDRLGWVKRFGFKDREELWRAELGEPVLACRLSEEGARSYSTLGRLAPLLVCHARWYFPILADGKVKGVIIAHHTREDDDWGTGVGVGGGRKFQAMQELRAILESDPRFKGKSYDIRLVTFDWEYYPSTCFVEVSGEEYLVSLVGGDWSIGERLKFYPVKEVIGEVERRAREWREGWERAWRTPPPRR